MSGGRVVDDFWGVAAGGGDGVWDEPLVGVPAASSLPGGWLGRAAGSAADR